MEKFSKSNSNFFECTISKHAVCVIPKTKNNQTFKSLLTEWFMFVIINELVRYIEAIVVIRIDVLEITVKINVTSPRRVYGTLGGGGVLRGLSFSTFFQFYIFL